MRTVRNIVAFVRHILANDSIGIAAKTAFFFLLAIFPLVMVTSWTLGYFNLTLEVLEGFLPSDMIVLMEEFNPPSAMASPFWFLGILWAASSGVWALMRGINHAYSEKPLRFVRPRLMSIAFTLGFIVVISLTLALLAVGRRSALLLVGIAIYLLIFALYMFTPGTSAKPGRVGWTALLATVGWLAASSLFSVYMQYFSNFSALYGSMGVFLGLALWVFAICLIIILGAELGGFEITG